MPAKGGKPGDAGSANAAPPGTKSQSTSSALVRDVIRGLYEGRYAPGQRLVEPDLMAAYDVSRSTVREALKQLAADGIIVAHPHRGAQIRRLTRSEAANLFALTEVVLGLAARQAAAHIYKPGAREQIEALFQDIAAFCEEEGRFEFLRRRDRYLRALVRISENEELFRVLPRLQVHLIRKRLAVPPSERIRGYRKMTDAILRGDPVAAEKAARGYVARAATRTLPAFPERLD